MSTSRSCMRCKKNTVIRDDITGTCICTSCGIEQEFDNFQHSFGGISGPQGTFVRVGASASGYDFSYREKKLYEAQKVIEAISLNLGLLAATSAEVKQMVETITEREFGCGTWFPILVGACSYIVMRKNNRSLAIAEVASVVECDIHELGRMVARVVDFLDLKLPEFDIVAHFERAIRNCPSFAGISNDKMDKMIKQGRFLLQCAVNWFLTTGRRPLAVIVAVLAFVAELNQVRARIEDIAKELHAAVPTSKQRHKELLQTLVKVAQALPWGKNITVKNIVQNAPFVIQYIEMKSRSKCGIRNENVGLAGFKVKEIVNQCLQEDDLYSTYDGKAEKDSQYFDVRNRNGIPSVCSDEMEMLKLSQECLAMIYSKFKNEYYFHESTDESGESHRIKRRRGSGVPVHEWWTGESDLCKKLSLKQILEKNVGFNTLPPSFVASRLSCKRRKEKIMAAKQRINKVMQPCNVVLGGNEDCCLSEDLQAEKQQQQVVKDHLIDWEDCIIELLLLHMVKEDEIEQGHYNTLLDLHIFNSGCNC
ncbi:plant-specific TFIIB-related protein PTF2-like [Telopea speciosissima]|uniref:plant-specific TFIIB-related protein PTF2-like n=1 Tax=Telopea speciosissima TaxID=54955 RepID=UPI001CC433FE|nr:plant-specific TFIIB-related protein PTF2-like [Telopea speciosissima]